MIINVNGEAQTWEGPEINIVDLLAGNKVDRPDMVSVQINGSFVDKKEYSMKKVVANDEVDFLYFIGGGKTS